MLEIWLMSCLIIEIFLGGRLWIQYYRIIWSIESWIPFAYKLLVLSYSGSGQLTLSESGYWKRTLIIVNSEHLIDVFSLKNPGIALSGGTMRQGRSWKLIVGHSFTMEYWKSDKWLWFEGSSFNVIIEYRQRPEGGTVNLPGIMMNCRFLFILHLFIQSWEPILPIILRAKWFYS